MKKFDWKGTVEIVGIAALVVSLVLVAFELRQSQVIGRMDVYAGLSSSSVEARDAINRNAALWRRGASGKELSELEEVVFDNLVLNVNEQAISAYFIESGLGYETEARLTLDDFAAFLHQNPGARRAWLTREQRLNRNRRILSPDVGDLWSFWQDEISEALDRLDAADQRSEYQSSDVGVDAFANPNADREAIQALLDANEAATNRRDAAAVGATFVSDAELWIAGGARFSGVAEIRQNEEAFYQTPGLQAWNVTVESIRFLTSDVALVDAVSITSLDNGQTNSRAGIVVVRTEEGWRIAAVHVMDVEE